MLYSINALLTILSIKSFSSKPFPSQAQNISNYIFFVSNLLNFEFRMIVFNYFF